MQSALDRRQHITEYLSDHRQATLDELANECGCSKMTIRRDVDILTINSVPIYSLSSQISSYSELIQSNPEWVYVGVYSDEAISGTKSDRPGFQKMIGDAVEGKIDVILCKSISRFSRNTVDLLKYVRLLKAKNVEVRFEKEGVNTLSADGELMLSLLASFAQAESHSISENIKWGIRKNFQNGYGNQFCLYGYKWNKKLKEFEVVPDQAAIIKLLFSNYLDGISAEKSAKQLNELKIPSYSGGKWTPETIRRILQNERYTGNQKLQKEYITDHITHKRTKNNGEVESYWVTGVAPEIVDLETYKKVQEIIQWKRDTNYKASQSDHPFARRLICADCGATYRRNIKRRGDYEYISWYCRKNDKGKCHSEHWAEEKLKEKITELLGWTVFDGDRFKREVNQVILGAKEIRILRKDGTEKCQER